MDKINNNIVTRRTVKQASEIAERAYELCYHGKLSPYFVAYTRRYHRWLMKIHKRAYIPASKS